MRDFNIFAVSPITAIVDLFEDKPTLQAVLSQVHGIHFHVRTLTLCVDTSFEKDFLNRFKSEILKRMKEKPYFEFWDSLEIGLEADRDCGLVAV